MAAWRRGDACLAGAAAIAAGAERAREPQRRSEAVAAGADALAGQGDPPPRHVHSHLAAAAPNEQVVGAGEGIDAVVVRPVRKGGQLVEQLLAVPAADELDQPVLCRRRDRLGADQFAAGYPLGKDPVATQQV